MQGDADSHLEPERLAPARSWSASQWAVGGRRAGPPPLERWEAVLRAERSTPHRLILIAARMPRLRRFLGLPVHLGRPPGPSLEERERQVAGVGRLGIVRALSRQGEGGAGSSERRATGGRPVPGSFLDSEVDAALALLTSMAFEELQARGWHLQPNSFAWPLNDVRFLRDNPDLWMRRQFPAAIDWDLEDQVQLARRLTHYVPELSDVPAGVPSQAAEFSWHNGVFSGGDAYSYYGLVRELGPKNVIEVGSGWSSLVLTRALSANSRPAKVTLIEPAPTHALLADFRPRWRLLPKIVQHVDLEVFDVLRSGDILFYDGSHAARTAGDLNWMLFEVLSRLEAGVWIHFHDVFWPHDYPAHWILDEGLSWNEQYLLRTFLMFNRAYRIELFTAWLWNMKHDLIREKMPMCARGGGGQMWLRKVGGKS